MYVQIPKGWMDGWMDGWILELVVTRPGGRGGAEGGDRSRANLGTYNLLVNPLLLDDELIVELVQRVSIAAEVVILVEG